jgi:hypothetical protein
MFCCPCLQDYANVDQAEQDKILAEARQVLAPWDSKLVWLRMLTTQAVRYVRERLDYVYVDARHDYCGTLEDIQTWWPLIRSGGSREHRPVLVRAVALALELLDFDICNTDVARGVAASIVLLHRALRNAPSS